MGNQVQCNSLLQMGGQKQNEDPTPSSRPVFDRSNDESKDAVKQHLFKHRQNVTACRPDVSPKDQDSCGDSSEDEETGQRRHLSKKSNRVLRIVKKIIGDEHVDFNCEQTLIHLIENTHRQSSQKLPEKNQYSQENYLKIGDKFRQGQDMKYMQKSVDRSGKLDRTDHQK